jgi:hypothetical protein
LQSVLPVPVGWHVGVEISPSVPLAAFEAIAKVISVVPLTLASSETVVGFDTATDSSIATGTSALAAAGDRARIAMVTSTQRRIKPRS